MVRYLSLISFTDQGIRSIDKTCERGGLSQFGGGSWGRRVLGLYWAVGEYDGAIVFETPDEATTARLLMSLAKLRNVRTKSMRVHDEAEFRGVLTK